MKGQVKRSMKVLRRSDKQGIIPMEILYHAKGIVFMTQVKGAFVFGGTVGGGIFLKKLAGGVWSPPVSIGMSSIGVGLQIGGQKADIVIILNDESAVKTFEAHGQLKLGGDYAATAGPVGRTVKAELGMSSKGFSGSFCYSMSQGLFIGISLEGAVLVTRGSDNKSFYGTKDAHIKNIFAGEIKPPQADDKKKNVDMLHLMINNLAAGRSSDTGFEVIATASDVEELDNDDDFGDEQEGFVVDYGAEVIGHNTKNDDDLVRKQRAKPKQHARRNSDQELASSGKDLLVGALEKPETLSRPAAALPYPTSAPYPATNPFEQPTPIIAQPITEPPTIAQPLEPPSQTYQPVQPYSPEPPKQQTPPLIDFSSTDATPFGGKTRDATLSYGSPRVLLTRDHIVEEDSAAMKAHNIISARRGDPCFLIDGSLQLGLPVPYQDYVTIQRLSDGRTGKVSRFCLARAI